MPEGPTIFNLKNKLNRFRKKTVTEAGGYGEMDKSGLAGQQLLDIDSYGKNFIFIFKDFFITVHLGLFGSMLINKRKKSNASFSLHFDDSMINFYIANAKRIDGKPQDHFNYNTDILKDTYDGEFVLSTVQEKYKEKMIGDVLMEQELFAGVGNIIRIESLYRSKIHPDSLVKYIPEKKLVFLIETVVNYGFEFLEQSKTDTVKEKTLIYGRKICPKDKRDLIIEEMGKVKRKTYVCPKCQKLYS